LRIDLGGLTQKPAAGAIFVVAGFWSVIACAAPRLGQQ
jgi:hypothetical protein